MTTTSAEPKDSPALTGLTELYRDSMEGPTTAELDRGLDAFVDRVASAGVRRRGLGRWSVVGVTVALATLVVLGVASIARRPSPVSEPAMLAYEIDGGSVLEGGYLRESGHAGMKVLFNEGSRLTLASGTRGRIRAVDREGAHLAIERGTASFQVTHSSSRRWLVDVGPFLVTVKGTAFTVSWDPLSERFELRLRHGRVVVSGPVSAGEVTVRAGQRLVVNLPRAETVITEEFRRRAGSPDPSHEETPLTGLAALGDLSPLPRGEVVSGQTPEQGSGEAVGGPAPPPATPTDPQPSAVGEQPAGRSAPVPPGRSSVAKLGGERRWSDELARGHWDRILADVKRIGVDATLSSASSEELFALADAARYRRRPDLARAALLAERRRFPESPRALDAIYLLGRVEESRENGTAQAIAWYDEYLTRAPTGPFVGEALGRKMTLTDKLEGPTRARPVAEDYLRRFPKGNYAGSARELIRAP